MAKKDLINKSGVARSFPGSFPQRGLNGLGCLFYVGVSNGDRGECGEYGGVEGRVGRRTVAGWRAKRLGRNSVCLNRGGKTGVEV
nr:hypothetical protein [Tanacetum cinerariifolium]